MNLCYFENYQKSLVILSICILLVYAEKKTADAKIKQVHKESIKKSAGDLDAEASGRVYNSGHASPGSYRSSYGSSNLHGPSSPSAPQPPSRPYGPSSLHGPSSPSRPRVAGSRYGPSNPSNPRVAGSLYGPSIPSSSPHLSSSPYGPSSSSNPHAPLSGYGHSSPHTHSGGYDSPSLQRPYSPSSSHRPVSSYGPSSYGSSNSYGPPAPQKSEYGLVHDYPQSGYGKLDPTADKPKEEVGGYRKGVEHTSAYGYGGYDNRGPALPSAYGKATGDQSGSYYQGPSYGSGPAPVHDSYSKPSSGYGPPSGYIKPGSGYNEPSSYSKPSSGYNEPSGYSKPASGYNEPSSYSKPVGGYNEPSSYGKPAAGYSRPINEYDSSYSSGYSKPLGGSKYSSGYPKSSGGLQYSKPLPQSGHSQPSRGYDDTRTYGAYSAAPPSGHGPTSYTPKPYSVPASKPYSGYVAAPAPSRGYAPPSGSGYSAGSGYSSAALGGRQAVPVPHVNYAPSSGNGYSSSSQRGYAPGSAYYDGYPPKVPAAYSSHARHQSNYYAPESLGGYAAPPVPSSYTSKVQNYPVAARSGSSYNPEAYGKTYGTVTQKEYSKTVETYGSSGGEGGHSYGLARRAALHADHGLYGSASYGRRYDLEQPQVQTPDQAIYGGYGHLY